MSESPEHVFTRASAGDETAWREIVLRYQRLVYATIRETGIVGDDAEDVFQEAFVRLHANLERIEDPSRTAKWLTIVTRRLCLDVSDRHRRARGLPADVLDPESDEAPDEAVLRLERQHAVRDALGELDPRCRRLLGLLYHEQREPDYADAARQLGIPVGSVGPTRGRCLEKLLRRLRLRGFFTGGETSGRM
jgi:RNA polymerase sigma factor (sigma-70 family)